jgi:hypothetical protein
MTGLTWALVHADLTVFAILGLVAIVYLVKHL